MYGDGKNTDHPQQAQQFAEEATKDLAVMLARFNAARQVLAAEARVDPEKVAAIGYCFGGAVVLNVARSGSDLDAVVSFHGDLSTQTPAKRGQVQPRILVLTGGADPFIPPAAVEKFRQEMMDAGADFRIVTYPGAKHSFTNPAADSHGMPQAGYQAEADKQSWEEMLIFFKRVLG
jgi:dienelactone hydrolase